MSFFNDIGKNISSKTKEISQKAKIMSESSSLNNIIKGEECKIDFQYKTIGKLYFEKYGENADEEFSEAIQIIKNSMEKIQQTQDEIKRIKSIFNCPNCGAPFKNNAVFCAKCGAKLPEKEEKSNKDSNIPEGAQKCASCGNILTKEALFCNVCGNKLGEQQEAAVNNDVVEASTAEILTSDRNSDTESSASAEVPAPTEIKEPVSEQKNETADMPETVENTKKICPNCQNEMLDEDVFCNVCGNKFE